MSIEISDKKLDGNFSEYFIYLKSRKILKSVFSDKPVITGLLFFVAFLLLKISGVNWEAIKKFGGKLLQVHRRINALVVRFENGLPENKRQFLENLLDAEIEPVTHVNAMLNNSVPQIKVEEVRNSHGYEGKNVKVAVIDTGIDDTHPDIKNRVIHRKNFTKGVTSELSKTSGLLDKILSLFTKSKNNYDGNGHGTHCAVVVGGRGIKYRGVAPKVALIDAKVLADSGGGSNAGVIKGMSWAASKGADIISLSLGSPRGKPDDAVSREANELAKDGIVVVVAAGNDGPNGSTIGSPGCAEEVITVGSVDKDNKIPRYSSRGPVVYKGVDLNKPDVLAPGGGISGSPCPYSSGIVSGKSSATKTNMCSVRDSRGVMYQKMSGTSMATPHVAGLVAILIEASGFKRKIKSRCSIIKRVLRHSATNLGLSKNEQGSGLVNAEKAIKMLEGTNHE